jgi:hypothetical protein
MTQYKLGKKIPRIDKRTLKLSKYLLSTIPTPPAIVDWTPKVNGNWPMYGNDTMGDCTCAAAGHMIEAWTANAGTLTVPQLSDILAAYNVVDGGVDQGADMLTVLNYWSNTGIGTDKIYAFAQIQVNNPDELQASVSLFCGAYLGLALPDNVVNNVDMLTVPWTDTSMPPGPNNGHCVPVVGYDADNIYVVTWGVVKAMSWAFYGAYVDEAYCVLSQDWINSASGQAPSGFDLPTLQADLAAIPTTQ